MKDDHLLDDLRRNHEAIGRSESIYSRAIEAITRLTHAAKGADYLEQRIREKDEVFAEIRRVVGGNVSGEVIEEPDPDAPWLPVGLILRIDEVMEQENRS